MIKNHTKFCGMKVRFTLVVVFKSVLTKHTSICFKSKRCMFISAVYIFFLDSYIFTVVQSNLA